VSHEDWPDYIGQFHRAKAGITEAVLGQSRADGATPYEWLGSSLAKRGSTIDLACGSAPMQSVIGDGWLGVDLSEAELTAARARHGAAPLCRADAGALPFREHGADAVMCCMGLMVIPAFEATLREVTRVARRDALIAVLVPAARPLTARDRLRHARLLFALRITSFQYPNPEVVRDPAQILQSAGLTVLDDTSKRFAFTLADDAAAYLLVESLYLPHTSPRRVNTAKRLTRRWLQTDLGIPLRRLVAKRA
jgi:ubiquinone/menaquinone biosynthesis C-methylase UbiE